jgi:hypothetical protein
MKRPLVLLFPIILMGCKQEMAKPDEPYTDKLIGEWTPKKHTYIESRFQNNVLNNIDTIVFIGQPGEYFSIKTDNSFEQKNIKATSDENGNVWYEDDFQIEMGKYLKTLDSLILRTNTDTIRYAISHLDNSSLIISYTDSSVSGSIKDITKGTFEYKR